MLRYVFSLFVVAVVAVAASAAVTMFLPAILPVVAATGAIPVGTQTINHQGVVAVDGTPFNGTGTFYFAIIDPDTPTTCNRWTNDVGYIAPASATSAQPANGVSLMVTNGIYSVRLGDVNLDPAHMKPVPSSIFSKNNLQLRIWFNDGPHGPQQLSPDQPLCSAPYAMSSANGVPLGTIAAWHKNIATTALTLPDGWQECNGDPLPSDSPLRAAPYSLTVVPNLNDKTKSPNAGYGGGRFLRGSTHSGDLQDSTQLIAPGAINCGNFGWGDSRLFWSNMDGLSSTRTYNTILPSGSICNSTTVAINGVRPMNLSVVWIMRVK